MSRDPYAPHAALTEPALPSRGLPRLVGGLFVAGLLMFGLARGVMSALSALLGPEAGARLVDQMTVADTPLGLLVLLFMMGAMGLATVVVAEYLHKRPGLSLFGPARLFWRQFLRVLGALVILNLAISLLPPWPLTMATEPGLPLRQWLALLPATLMALMVQTGSEELLFRGYFQSQLAARFPNPLVWLVVPSLVFALGHYAPESYGSNALLITLWAFLFGLAAADLTARSGSLGPALAMHLVNNFSAMALMSLQGEMSGLALMKLPFGPGDEAQVAAWLPIDLCTMGLSWLTARIALRV